MDVIQRELPGFEDIEVKENNSVAKIRKPKRKLPPSFTQEEMDFEYPAARLDFSHDSERMLNPEGEGKRIKPSEINWLYSQILRGQSKQIYFPKQEFERAFPVSLSQVLNEIAEVAFRTNCINSIGSHAASIFPYRQFLSDEINAEPYISLQDVVNGMGSDNLQSIFPRLSDAIDKAMVDSVLSGLDFTQDYCDFLYLQMSNLRSVLNVRSYEPEIHSELRHKIYENLPLVINYMDFFNIFFEREILNSQKDNLTRQTMHARINNFDYPKVLFAKNIIANHVFTPRYFSSLHQSTQQVRMQGITHADLILWKEPFSTEISQNIDYIMEIIKFTAGFDDTKIDTEEFNLQIFTDLLNISGIGFEPKYTDAQVIKGHTAVTYDSESKKYMIPDLLMKRLESMVYRIIDISNGQEYQVRFSEEYIQKYMSYVHFILEFSLVYENTIDGLKKFKPAREL